MDKLPKKVTLDKISDEIMNQGNFACSTVFSASMLVKVPKTRGAKPVRLHYYQERAIEEIKASGPNSIIDV